MSYIPRTLGRIIKKFQDDFQAIFISGPRQSGKTTLIKRLFPDYKYYNLETPIVRELANKDPLGILSESRLVLDEAQEVPLLFSYLLEQLDSDKSKKVIIAGSQNLLLHHHIPQSLAGRVAVLELLPLTIKEVVRASSNREQLEFSKLAVIGLYPPVYLKNSQEFSDMWYQSYIQTYIERDVRRLKNVKDLLRFQDFIKLLATQAGTLLNLSSISNQLGVSVTTLGDWLSVLEASYIVFRLRPYRSNIKKRVVKTPKVYFYDTGLLCHLLGIRSVEDLNRSFLYGQIFENFIVANIIKMYKHLASKRGIYFIRDKTGNEIDVLIEDGPDTFMAIEIKSGKTFNTQFVNSIVKYQDLLNFSKSLVVYQGEKLAYKGINVINWRDLGRVADDVRGKK